MPFTFDLLKSDLGSQIRGANSHAELQRLFTALEEVIESSAIGPWLTAPNDAFDGLKPLEVIDRGEIDRIWQMIYQLRSGVAF